MSGELRLGETLLALPEKFDAGIYFIGRIRTPWRNRSECPKNANGSDTVCTVEIELRYAEALMGVEAASHLILLYWMDQARRDLAVQMPRHHDRPKGTFSVRSPARPNPIALSVAKLVSRDGTRLSVVGLDCLDGTPLIDLKPYLPSVDSRPDATISSA